MRPPQGFLTLKVISKLDKGKSLPNSFLKEISRGWGNRRGAKDGESKVAILYLKKEPNAPCSWVSPLRWTVTEHVLLALEKNRSRDPIRRLTTGKGLQEVKQKF